MLLLQSFKNTVHKTLVRIGRVRLHRQLSNLSERQLIDAGFSPELLREGVAAWPWRLPADTFGGSAVIRPFTTTGRDRATTDHSAADQDPFGANPQRRAA